MQSLENFVSMVIQGTQVPMYTKHTLFLYFYDSFYFFLIFIWKTKQSRTENNKNMLNKAKHNANAWGRKRREGDQSMEMTLMFWRRNSKCLLSRGLVNKSAFWSSVWINKLPSEVMSNLYVFGSRILNQILRDVDDTGIVTINSEMLLTNTIIMEEILHP